MAPASAETVYRVVNLILSACALAVAALIVVEIEHRRTRKLDPLGVAFCAVFLTIGVRAAVRLAVNDFSSTPPRLTGLLILVDAGAALAAGVFLALRRRYRVFVESVDLVRAYETEYAEKEREARALAQVNDELRRLDQLKSEFLAMVSHELRTPLTAIIGYSRLLLRQAHGSLTPKQIEQQEAIFRSGQRLTDLINDLLDVSRLEAGRVELAPRPTDVRQVVQQVMGVVAPAARAKEIRLTATFPPDFPRVHADPTRLQQILVNLVGNAVKFTGTGGSVRVHGGRQGDKTWIAVEDDGVGIAPDELSRIWDLFYQVESPMRRRHGGSGLGLTMVRRLVELHGGVVRAESEGESRGSRFTFTLPVAHDQAIPEVVDEVEVSTDRILNGLTVLIVEDEEENQELMRAVIEDVLGGTVSVCADGERAVGEAVDHAPDLILLDLMLPRVSGWEVARRLRQSARTRAIPIIAVSALARPQEREAALHAGCNAYLAKPFTPDAMARVIATTLQRMPGETPGLSGAPGAVSKTPGAVR
jgi:signal transduction histidine kinase/ActR/RegA family two-component response regulator